MISNLLKAFASGAPLIMIDDSIKKKQAAIICLAEFAEPDVINLMIKHARGNVSVVMTPEMALQAELCSQRSGGYVSHRNYTISIDAEETTTGISAFERSFSIKKLAATGTSLGFKKPGHIFPLICHPEGLYGQISVVEASIDLTMISDKPGMVVVCDLLDLQGDLADGVYAQNIANHLRIPIVYVSDILKERITKDGLLRSRKSEGAINDSIRLISYGLHDVSYYVGLNLNKMGIANIELEEAMRFIEATPYNDYWKQAFMEFSSGQRCAFLFDTDTRKTKGPPFMRKMIYQFILADLKPYLSSLYENTGRVVNH